MHIVADLIEHFDPKHPNFRPTEIYNEGWLLKGLLHAISQSDLAPSPLSFSRRATWFSEALLPMAFRARYRGDKLAEARTNADGVIGQILIGEKGKADLALAPGAAQFVVVEAKISAPLSSGTSRAPWFDQAARNVACIAEVLRRANRPPHEMEKLAFIVLAPQQSIAAGRFSGELDLAAMQGKIRKRAGAYGGDLDSWYDEWAEPTLASISIHALSWEQAIYDLGETKPEAARSLQAFYELCLDFN